jgi:hypothetical protein
LILARTFRSSSARPSEKYSSSGLALRLANGQHCDRGYVLSRASVRAATLDTLSKTPKLVVHVESGLEALARALLQTAAHDALEIERETGAHPPERGRRVAKDRGAYVGGCLPGERAATGGELVEDDSQREEIASRIHGLAAQLLRSHVRHRPHHLPIA